jgi:hypothetical protein
VTAAPAIGTASRNELLAPEAGNAVSAAASLELDRDLIDPHATFVIIDAKRCRGK